MAYQRGAHLVLAGSSAFSDFRLARLAKELSAIEIRAIWIHFVHAQKDLDSTELDVLEQLLHYGDFLDPQERLNQAILDAVLRDQPPHDSKTALFYVCPRAGTISPWSSQATNIAHVCTLENSVKRIERGMVIAATFPDEIRKDEIPCADSLHDRMTQTISRSPPDLESMFAEHDPAPEVTVPVLKDGKSALEKANRELGLALDKSEIEYLVDAFVEQLQRDPFTTELFMWAQVNSEHCRHKQFNAEFTVNGLRKQMSLFAMIRNTHNRRPNHVVSAYSDNAAVLHGASAAHWAPSHITGEWKQIKETVHICIKVETHNHPTAVSPYPGAATGSGGEIRDEGAVGRGSKPKTGLCGFNVSDLLIPGFKQPWELDPGKPEHIASSLDIMLEAPIGSANYNNEFGRPCTAGYFRTLLTNVNINDEEAELRGYHKPIMIAGGVGSVRPLHAIKEHSLVKAGAHLIVLGGPAMLIGLGGGSSSSVQSGDSKAELDFASVQRGNAEVQRRAQEVINACVALGDDSPIKLIHDVGAGGLSNALPEIVHDARLGAKFELRAVDNADKGMSPLQIWCCEAQERYVLAISNDGLDLFKRIARRERCGYSVVGVATKGMSDQDKRIILTDRDSQDNPTIIDLPMSVLFGKPPKMTRIVDSRALKLPAFDKTLATYIPETPKDGLLDEAVSRVLALPAVGSKSFLITIGDRTVGGLTARDQMVGKFQTPVADVSVTATSLLPGTKTGEAMAMGERPMLALISAGASARMAVVESLTNIAAAHLKGRLDRVRLSANWMCASSHPGEAAGLYEAVETLGMELCPKLGISIPVGKDSMSMKMKWKDEATDEAKEVTAPMTVVISAFGLVEQINNTWTPALRPLDEVGESVLMYVDIAGTRKALGGSALAQVFGQMGNDAPDVRDVDLIKDYFDAVEQLHEAGIVLAYHDRSDGGLFTTFVEMMFAGRCGLEIMLDELSPSSLPQYILETLFNEELGGVFQVRKKDIIAFKRCFATCGPPPGLIKVIGRIPAASKQEISIRHGNNVVYRASRSSLQQRWAATSHEMQKIRDNPACADSEYDGILDDGDPGLSYQLTYKPKDAILPFATSLLSSVRARPRVAILREQGVNGHAEMAFAFASAGFSAIDVHMTDILSGRVSLASFTGLAACGGFSYGDVLGAGQGWAKSVLLHKGTRDEFQTFFNRPDTFSLGVCNGCQFLTRLRGLIPGAGDDWPVFERNTSEQYEARVCMVSVSDAPSASPSVFLHGMQASRLPIPVAHGEGRAVFTPSAPAPHAHPLVALRYVDNRGNVTERYPANPNGSPAGVAGMSSRDGRVLALMPHPERAVLRESASWIPDQEECEETGWDEEFGPWIRLFRSARRWVG